MSAGLPLKPPEPRVVQDAPTIASASRTTKRWALLVNLQHRHERLLRNLDRANPLHSPLPFLLLLQQFAFPGDVASIAFRKHVLPHRRDGFSSDHLAPDRGLDRHLIDLARNDGLQLLDQLPSLGLGLAAVRAQRTRRDRP